MCVCVCILWFDFDSCLNICFACFNLGLSALVAVGWLWVCDCVGVIVLTLGFSLGFDLLVVCVDVIVLTLGRWAGFPAGFLGTGLLL